MMQIVDKRLSNTYPRTDEECPKCEDGYFLQDDHSVFCENCHYAPERSANRVRKTDEWVDFWQYRTSEYSGFRGPERVKVVGGFASAYFESDGLY